MNYTKTYKITIAFSFVALLCIQTFFSLFITAGYYLNTPVYAANCVNKSKPQMHCNGKCQLQKKLNEENNKDKQNTERKNDDGLTVISSKTFFSSVKNILIKAHNKNYIHKNSGSPVDKSFAFFHPPQHFSC